MSHLASGSIAGSEMAVSGYASQSDLPGKRIPPSCSTARLGDNLITPGGRENASTDTAGSLETSHTWDWSVFSYASLKDQTRSRPLGTFVLQTLQSMDLLGAAGGIPTEELGNWLHAVERDYRPDLPYHNALHAIDVTHSVAFLVRHPTVAGMLKDSEKLVGVHD
jgi:hypothetical protein